MKNILKIAGVAGLLATAAVSVAATSFAGDTRPAERQAILTNLGGKASAVTYWVKDSKGYEVITTLDAAAEDGARPAVVRVSTVLQPGQQQVISLPAPVGQQAATLRISRVADRIEVEKVGTPTY
ncbi:hypothetical protein EZH22_14695 [Xanthobacter dioxanivorans]|uniref:Uncharacterized protein n=1 Tax=Xanthobacter dioxanivorans TaxID=2528964 RepID=A0A974PJQ0_9HYPH|nr:hypothetical protein [Xanthobacter dioxanivorans]QRG04459.1 hypothetical protein EZH22_14695 [Xanthobacter dioxanivorans]